MTAGRTLVSALGIQAAADVAQLVQGEASIEIAIDGVPARALVREYFGDVDDPRKPELYVSAAALPVGQHGKPVTIGGETFTIEGVRPVAPGLVRLVLS